MTPVDGYRAPHEVDLPDVTLTGDEFLHMTAIFGEVLPGNPTAHRLSRSPLGFPSPACSCCQSIMQKAEEFLKTAERLRATPSSM